jgi:undecaprenyl-diphosphatase
VIKALLELDESIARWSNQSVRRTPGLGTVAAAIAVVGSWSAAGLLSLIWLRAVKTSKPIERHAAERAFLGVALTYLFVEAIGRLLPRTRPFAASPDALGLVAHTEHRSFPSRHVASACAMAIAISPTSKSLAACFGLVGGLLGAARVAAGVHYPSDVVAGMVLGAAVGRMVRCEKRLGKGRR